LIAGINGSEALILLVIILIVVGPERLPRYAAQLGKFIRGVKQSLGDAQEKVREEMNEQGEDIPWEKFDPRQYDPRRIVRDALSEDADTAVGGVAGATSAVAAAATMKLQPGEAAPFDDEAT